MVRLQSKTLLGAAALLAVASFAVPSARAQTEDEAVVFHGPAVVARGHTVESLVVFEGPTRVDGTVTEDVVALGGDVYVTGVVGGDVVALGGVPHVASSARIGGDIVSSRTPAIAHGASVNGHVRQPSHQDGGAWSALLAYFLSWLGMAISVGVLALLLGWLVPPQARDTLYRTARAEPGASLGVGLLITLGLPLLAVAAMLTVVGIPLGVAVLLALVLVALAGFVATGWVIGRAIAERTQRPHEELRARLGWVLLGVGLLSAAALIPFVGGLVWVAASALGTGAAALAIYRSRRPRVEPPGERARPAAEEEPTFEPPPYPEERPAGA